MIRLPTGPALWRLLCVGWLSACASAAPPAPTRAPTVHDYYPLRVGSAWSYDVDAGGDDSVLAITRVERVEGDVVEVRTGEGLLGYRLVPDGIVRALDGSYLLKAPLSSGASWPSSKGATASVQATGLSVETLAGHFDGCVRVHEQGGASGAVIETVYCPAVGPVRVLSTLELTRTRARVEARLRGFVIGDRGAQPEAGASTGPAPATTRTAGSM